MAYDVNKLSQFMHCPTTEHWQAAKCVLRYLSGTLNHGIYLRKQSSRMLCAFSDAYWAGDSDDYVSKNAYIIFLGSQPISWTTKRQKGLRALRQKQSTVLLLIRLPRSDGLLLCSQNLVFESPLFPQFIAKTLQRLTSALIRSFILV